MSIKLTPKFIVSFVALFFVMNEAHELVHVTVGRFLCSCWGERDFNGWGLCEGCLAQRPYALAATFAGPVFTFTMIWTGAHFLGERKSDRQKSFGYSLIFANMPFARLFQPLIGGGDEVWALTKLLPTHTSAQIIGFLTIGAITFFPLRGAYRLVENKGKVLYFIGFLVAPVLLDHLVLLGVMNGLLNRGILTKSWIAGSPGLVTVWTLFMLVLFLSMREYIFTLAKPTAEARFKSRAHA